MVPLFHDDGKVNPCYYKGVPTGNCPRGTITLDQENYYANVKVTCDLSDLKPNYYQAVVIKENGAINFKGAYHNPELNGPEYQPFGKTYGFLFEAQGDCDGKLKDYHGENEVINMFEPFSVYGRAVEINLPTKREQGDSDKTRVAAISNLGKTGADDVPIWDKGPEVCNDDTTKTHGGGNESLCEIYKRIVTGYPDIAVNMPLFHPKRYTPKPKSRKSKSKR